MRTEEEIRNRLNAVKMDFDFAISQGKEEQDILKMNPYIHALEWVLDDRTEADEDIEPSATVNSVPIYKKESPELLSPYEMHQLRFKRKDPNEV